MSEIAICGRHLRQQIWERRDSFMCPFEGHRRKTINYFISTVCSLSFHLGCIHLNFFSGLSAGIRDCKAKVIGFGVCIKTCLLRIRTLQAHIKIEHGLEEPTLNPFLKHCHKGEDESTECNEPV